MRPEKVLEVQLSGQLLNGHYTFWTYLRLSRRPLMHIGNQNNRLSNVAEGAKSQDRRLKPVFAARKLRECMCMRMGQAARRGFLRSR